MRPIYVIMAGVAACTLATPASSAWQDRTYSQQLQVEIDAGVRQGTISRRESIGLRQDLGRLVRLERRVSPDGISGPEHAQLLQRSTALAKEIRIASGEYDLRTHPTTWTSGNINGHWVADARFAGLHPGDRFNGDARVGQHVTSRIQSMPAQYRHDYVDSDRAYYGYDDGRVYQIDRKSQIILALLDMQR